MKTCLMLQRRFVYVGHQLAVNLKEKYGVQDFCAYVFIRSGYDFLKQQQDIQYSSLLLDEDIHKQYVDEKLDLGYLKKLEQDYGLPNLWPYIEVDRVIRFNQLVREYPYNTPKYSHEEMMRLLQVRAKALLAMIEKEKPDIILTSIVGAIGSYLLTEIAKKKGIKMIFISTTRVGNLYTLSEHFSNFTEVDKLFEPLQKSGSQAPLYEQAKKLLNDFRSSPKTFSQETDYYRQRADRLKQLDFLLPKKLGKNFLWQLHSFSQQFRSAERYDYSFIHPWSKLKDQLRRKFRNLLRPVSYDAVELTEDFAFFPLHFEPEIATSLFAPFYTDQLNLIRQIARSLPIHFKLYVKEHPTMHEYRPRSYYHELKKIPNVRLVSPKLSSLELINNCRLVTTITGSAGWEATQLRKPVITFGDVFYNKFSFVKRCREIEGLPYLIKDQLDNFHFDEQELINYIACILSESVDVNLAYLWEKESDLAKKKKGSEPLADLIYNKLIKTS